MMVNIETIALASSWRVRAVLTLMFVSNFIAVVSVFRSGTVISSTAEKVVKAIELDRKSPRT